MNKFSKILLAWFAPFAFLYLYAVIRYALYFLDPSLVGLPSIVTIRNTTLLEMLISPLWVSVAAGATYFFGGVLIIPLMRAFAHNKILRRKIVVSGSITNIEKIAVDKDTLDFLSFRSFALTLGLTLGLNLMYTLLVQRYFSSLFPNISRVQVNQFLLSSSLLGVEFLLALVFMPLLCIVLPLVLGSIRIRQIDSSPLHYYWLNLVYSIAGGASAVLLILNIFEAKTGPKEFVIASLVLYGLISWYITLGAVLAAPSAQKKLARGLLKLKSTENVYFGGIFAGENPEESEEV